MPIPSPNKGEKQDEFMGRCMGMLSKENEHKTGRDKRPREQMVAICMNQWKTGKSKAEIEEEAKADDEFIKQFLAKHPEYKEYFEVNNDEQKETD